MLESNSHHPRILVADDQKDVREALRLLFKGEGFRTEAVDSPAGALAALEQSEFDVVLMDLNYARDTTSGDEGLDLLKRIQTLDPAMPVVVMTAWSSVELAVDAMRRGARDFVQKPWDNARLLATIRTQADLSRALRRGQRLEAENEMLRDEGGTRLVAESPAMRPVQEMIERVGPSDANILITGENGVGKGVIARALHAVSQRNAKPLITVNMGGLSEGVFESELFGHVKGAFTDAKTDRVGRFELAERGTLFLDEIANIPLNQQSRLLRVLETGEFERVGSSRTLTTDVRLISATNSDLYDLIGAGHFRRDLLYRLNTVEIHVPPLRERREDIATLANFFLSEHSKRYRSSLKGFEPSALALLMDHHWHGNVRELSHAVERAILMARGETIQASDLGLRGGGGDGAPRLDDMSLEEVERWLIKKALARNDGSANEAAKALGLSRSAFYRRLEKYGL